MTTWHTPETARALSELWPDIEQLEDPTLQVLLDGARDQVIAYAPALPAATAYNPVTVTLPPLTPYVEYQDAEDETVTLPVDGSVSGTMTLTRTGDVVSAEFAVTVEVGSFPEEFSEELPPGTYYPDVDYWEGLIPDAHLPLYGTDSAPFDLTGYGLEIDSEGAIYAGYVIEFDITGTQTLRAVWIAAPAEPDNVEDIPARYALGQFLQAKNMWNAGRVDASGGLGDGEGFVMRPTPLDWHIKQVLRPKRGAPRVR